MNNLNYLSKSFQIRLSFGICLSLLGALVLMMFQGEVEGRTSHFEGDFPAFYAAGDLARAADVEKLYRPSEQQAAQNKYWNMGGNYLEFAYPPFVALLISPAATYLSPGFAKGISMVLLVLLLYGCCKLFCKIQQRELPLLFVFTAWLSFFPLYSSVAGAQNSVISLFILLVFVSLLAKNTDRSEVMAGLALGLLLFKPHFAIIVAGALLLAGKRSLLKGFLVTALLIFCVTSAWFGLDWFPVWVEAVQEFSSRENIVNLKQQISLKAFLFSISTWILGAAPASFYNLLLNLLVLTISFAAVAFTVMRLRIKKFCPEDAFLLGPLVVMISPHTMYYDAALCLPALCSELSQLKKFVAYAGLIWLAVLACTLLKTQISFQPIFFLAPVIFVLAYARSR